MPVMRFGKEPENPKRKDDPGHELYNVIDDPKQERPLKDESIDVVYARQVLHHADDLCSLVEECGRVLRKGGMFLACREHVVNDEKQLGTFLSTHPLHALLNNENAFSVQTYLAAIDAVN